jgi:hypothetical protein
VFNSVWIERPCRNCALSNHPCTYALRDRKITVPESYLRNLEGGLISPKLLASTRRRPIFEVTNTSVQGPSQEAGTESVRHLLFPPVVENSTADLFVSKLKQIKITSPGVFGVQSDRLRLPSDDGEVESKQPQDYEYFALNFDTLRKSLIHVIACRYSIPYR